MSIRRIISVSRWPLSMWLVILPLRGEQAAGDVRPDGLTIRIKEAVAVLDAAQPRNDMNCELFPEAAVLGMDMKFHAGYEASLSLREVSGSSNSLFALLRVAAKNGSSAKPVYFMQRSRVPPVKGRSGELSLFGSFDLGEGLYHVDWSIRDDGGRFCSAHWDVKAALGPKEKNIAVALPAGAIRRSEEEEFQPEPPVRRNREGPPLHVKILVNAAPQRPDSAAFSPLDRVFLISILRNLARDARVGRISLVAFNIKQRQILYRQEASEQIDIPALGEALKKLKLGTVDIRNLMNKNGDAEFLSALVKNEISRNEIASTAPDGLIFAGPRSVQDWCIPKAELKRIGKPAFPVFSLTYSTDPEAVPWPDAIGRLIKFFKGQEYTISGPRELWYAVSDAVGRMEKLQQTPAAGVP